MCRVTGSYTTCPLGMTLRYCMKSDRQGLPSLPGSVEVTEDEREGRGVVLH